MPLPKPLGVALAFLGSALIGVPLLMIFGAMFGYASLFLYRRDHPGPGIGAVAGGISMASVLLVPLLCGIIGAIVAHYRWKR